MQTPAQSAGAGVISVWAHGSRCLAVQRTFHSEPPALEHMGVDHRRFDVLVAEQLLDGPNVVAIFEKVGGEAVAEGMRGNRLVYPGKPGGLFDRFLKT